MERNPISALVDIRTFSSLRHRNYRLLWTGNLVSQSGDWMDQVAFNWLVLELTGSPFYLGLVNLCRAVPILLFTLVGGVAADRVERRKLMMVTQTIAMVLALSLAMLVSTGLVTVWHIAVIAVLRGVMMSFNLPARQTIISDLVPRHDLANAIALNSMTVNLTRIIGPSLAGVLISFVGVAGCFYVNGLSFLAVLWTLQAMVFPRAERVRIEGSVRQSLAEGFRYIRGERKVALLIVVGLLPMFFGQPYMTMLTVFARDVLAIGAVGLGVLTSAAALGAVLGALALASLRSSAPRGAIMLGAMAVFGVLLILFSYSSLPALSVLLLVGIGAMNTSYNASNNTLLQLTVPDKFRGRVMSTLFIQRGLVPLGTTLAGALAVMVGARMAVASMASVIVLLGILALVLAPSLRQLK